MTLKIHGIGASRAARPLWTALELGVAFEHFATPYAGGATRTPEFLAINPNGHIPVVVDERPEGTVTVWESMACTLYLAKVHGKTPAQVILRWHIQLGNLVIPKSSNPERLAENLDVFDFELSRHELAAIDLLEDGQRIGPDPRTF